MISISCHHQIGTHQCNHKWKSKSIPKKCPKCGNKEYILLKDTGYDEYEERQWDFQWENFEDLYLIRRDGKKGILGVAFAYAATLIEYTHWGMWHVITLLSHKIKDGYQLTLLGPFVLLWWAITSLLYPIVMLPLIAFAFLCVMYTLVFELPSSTVRRNGD